MTDLEDKLENKSTPVLPQFNLKYEGRQIVVSAEINCARLEVEKITEVSSGDDEDPDFEYDIGLIKDLVQKELENERKWRICREYNELHRVFQIGDSRPELESLGCKILGEFRGTYLVIPPPHWTKEEIYVPEFMRETTFIYDGFDSVIVQFFKGDRWTPDVPENYVMMMDLDNIHGD